MENNLELLEIDRDKCKKDGICAAECPHVHHTNGP
ncbi:MAG: 4Fe-4S binding protein [Deltaproteobacteria bacterium]|nr:4Fe-4S binding protein [Deltaproteobacteria bacterium]